MIQGKEHVQTGLYPLLTVCEKFVCSDYTGEGSVDRFIKERLSFIEIAFRESEQELKRWAQDIEKKIKVPQMTMGVLRVPGLSSDGLRALRKDRLQEFQAHVNELNERLRRANTNLNYHNGFIQLSVNPLVESEIEKPYWQLVQDPVWKNVDMDMKEAIDRRDNGVRDAAFYAARALESTIKIISDTRGWTQGTEKGAHNFIDNLGSEKNGKFIHGWERDALKQFFSGIRNPMGHGPGKDEMPTLTSQQTNWVIESAMIWIKSLVQRT
jgi:hypothetical protein